MTSRHKIDPIGRADDQALAAGLALGCCLPNLAQDWPAGLVVAWNAAAEDGAFNDCHTFGDLARAFLRHRLETAEQWEAKRKAAEAAPLAAA